MKPIVVDRTLKERIQQINMKLFGSEPHRPFLSSLRPVNFFFAPLILSAGGPQMLLVP